MRLPPAPDRHRRPRGRRQRRRAFTLVELLVSTAVLVLLVLLVSQLFTSAVNVTTSGGKRMDADEQARVLFDRMTVDFARMVKRADVDYFLKQPANKESGNDQIAFYSEVPGYYQSANVQSPVSLVAYRVNNDPNPTNPNYQKVERLGKGLVWSGVNATDLPVFFLPVPLASPLASPVSSPPPTPAWPQAGSATTTDVSYELMGPQVFRMEYYYVLKGQNVAHDIVLYPAKPWDNTLSDTPWDTRPPASHTAVNGLADVAAIAMDIAVIDPKSHVLVTDAQLATLGTKLDDFSAGAAAGALEAAWQKTLNNGVAGFPPAASKSVRIYHRYFYLNSL